MAMKFPEVPLVPADKPGGGGGERARVKDLLKAFSLSVEAVNKLWKLTFSERQKNRQVAGHDPENPSVDYRIGTAWVDIGVRRYHCVKVHNNFSNIVASAHDSLRVRKSTKLSGKLTEGLAIQAKLKREANDLWTLYKIIERAVELRGITPIAATAMLMDRSMLSILVEEKKTDLIQTYKELVERRDEIKPSPAAEQEQEKPELLSKLDSIMIDENTSPYIREIHPLVRSYVETLGQQVGNA